MNHRAKFVAASFILGGEIRNRTNTHKNTQATNTIRCIHTRLAYRQVWIKTDAARLPNLTNKHMFHDESWISIYFGINRLKVKDTTSVSVSRHNAILSLHVYVSHVRFSLL